MKTHTKKTITAEELDEKFDNGEDISGYLDMANAKASIRIMLPISIRKKLLLKAKKEGKTLEEIIVNILLVADLQKSLQKSKPTETKKVKVA